MSSEMACRAASLTWAGAAKSGKPCERLTAPCFIARRVISRMTDSVNCSALAEIIRREICAIFDSGLLITSPPDQRIVSGFATCLRTTSILSRRVSLPAHKSSGTARRCATRFAHSREFLRMEWTQQVPELLHTYVRTSKVQCDLRQHCKRQERTPARL